MNATILLLIVTLVPVPVLAAALVAALLHARRLAEQRDELRREKDMIYEFVHDLGEIFAEGEDVELMALLRKVIHFAMRTTRASAGAIYLFSDDRQYLSAHMQAGLFPPLSPSGYRNREQSLHKSQHVESMVYSERISAGEGVVGQVADLGEPLRIDEPDADDRIPHYRESFLHLRSLLAVPMRFRHDVIGVLVVVNRKDEFTFDATDQNLLQTLADQASISTHFVGLRDTIAAKERIDRDLNVARQLQGSLLPRTVPQVPGFEFAAFNYPAHEVGGDYYDYVPVDDDHLGIAIADVSGKGIGGAIMMSICRSVLRAQAVNCLHPADVLQSVNRVLSSDIAEDMFVSMLYMILNIRNGELTVARAGHEYPLLFKTQTGHLSFVESPGVAVGMAGPEMFDATLEETTVQLDTGDLVAVYTDGITEAMNMQSEEWGVDAFMSALRTSGADGAPHALENVQERLLRFVGKVPQYDDMTLMVFRRVAAEDAEASA